MNFMKVTLLLLSFAFVPASSLNAFMVPEQPSTQEYRESYLWAFLVDCDIARLTFAELPTSHLTCERKKKLERRRVLACKLGYWDRPDLKQECLNGEIGSSYYNIFSRNYESCKEANMNALSNPSEPEISWFEYISAFECRNLWKRANDNFKHLAHYLEKECETYREAIRFDVNETRLNIARAQEIKPTFESVSTGRVAWFAHYWCILSTQNDADCFQSVIDSYIENQEKQLDIALSFEDMCANVVHMKDTWVE